RGDDAADFLVAQHLVVAGLLHVQDLALKGEDGLVTAVAAALGRASGGFALDDEQLAAGGVALLAIGQLPGQAAGVHGGLAAGELAGLSRGLAGACGVNALGDDAAADGGVLVEVFAQFLVDELLDAALDVAVQLALGLAFELGLRELDGNHADQPFAHVVAGDGDFVLIALHHAEGIGVGNNGAGKAGTEPGQVRAAVHGVDGVGEGEDVLRVAVVVLDGDFHLHVVALALDVDGGIVQRALAAVQVLHEFADAAGEAELGLLVRALVLEGDFEALVQEGQLAQALGQHVVTEVRGVEDFGIGMKGELRAGAARLAGFLEFSGRSAALVGLLVDVAVAANLQVQPVGKRVDHRDAHAVQPAGDFVGFAVEFAAGVKHGHHHFGRRALFRLVHVHGDAAAVVHHGYGIVLVDGGVDLVAEAGQRLVHGVVHDFPDQVVEAGLAGRADIHGGTLAHGLEAAEHLDGFCVVLVARSRRAG